MVAQIPQLKVDFLWLSLVKCKSWYELNHLNFGPRESGGLNPGVTEALHDPAVLKILSVPSLDTDQFLMPRRYLGWNHSLCRMHELKFIIKSWKKNQRFSWKKSHVTNNYWSIHFLKNFFLNLFLRNLVWLLGIKEVDLWHRKGGIREQEGRKWGKEGKFCIVTGRESHKMKDISGRLNCGTVLTF